MRRLGILISGRGSNMIAILKAVQAGKIQAIPAVIISNKPNALGLEYARSHGIPTKVIQSKNFSGTRDEYDSLIEDVLKEYKVYPHNGIICLAGFMRVLGPKFVKRYKNKILNIHPALLPSFPGIDAQKQAIEYGTKISGCTVHFVDANVDTGPILLQAMVLVNSDDTVKTLSERILLEEHKLYPKAIQMLSTKRVRVYKRRVIVS
ncbi:MAG: phosphoribosylglycinamide formyltransferase [Cenarchaeum symbiont of Oopsacas minuta]|nr:phosphoribosylglycinamide formyltransferase [Cenarchaeum symbiont of Oopsacas minuta]